MFKLASPLFLIAESPIHAGSGNDLGIIDLPIQREKHTGFPKIEASGLKGSLREIFDSQKDSLPDGLKKAFPGFSDKDQFVKAGIFKAFGPTDGSEHAGALGFTDVRLLLFPVKSVKGVFAWVTCPTVLMRFRNDLSLTKKFDVSILDDVEDMVNTIPENSGLAMNDNGKEKIVLEEYAFEVSKNDHCSKLFHWLAETILPDTPEYDFWREKMKTDLLILTDYDFADFITLSTEVIARTKIGENGTVDAKNGNLWYEEYLPADSIMYSLILTTTVFGASAILKTADDVMRFFHICLPEIFQIGGNATIGKGLVRTKMAMGKKAPDHEGEKDGR